MKPWRAEGGLLHLRILVCIPLEARDLVKADVARKKQGVSVSMMRHPLCRHIGVHLV
jgi:hypothetical protein